MGDYADILPFDEINTFEGAPAVFGKLLSFTPTVNELKVFEGDREQFDDA
jgi:hypothetical protein